MALTVTQRHASTGSKAAPTFTIVPSSNTTVGTLLVLAITRGSSETVTSITDAKGNTWGATADATITDAGGRTAELWSAQCTASILTTDNITINTSGVTSVSTQIWILEIGGAATSSAFDKQVTGSGAGNAPSVGPTATLSQANEIAIYLDRTNALTTFTPDWTTTGITANQGNSACEYNIVAATTALTAAPTTTGVTNWTGIIATYKAAGGGATSNPKSMVATVTLTAKITKSVGKKQAATVTLNPKLVKSVGKKLAATVTLTAKIVKSVGKKIVATVTLTAKIVRQTGKKMVATVSLTAKILKRVSHKIAATVNLTTRMVTGRAFLKSLQATVSLTAKMVRLVPDKLIGTGGGTTVKKAGVLILNKFGFYNT